MKKGSWNKLYKTYVMHVSIRFKDCYTQESKNKKMICVVKI